jgi:hypothetical protein
VLLVAATVVTACGSEKEKENAKPTRAPARGVSVLQLTELSASTGQPVYWAGAERGKNL